MWYRICWKSPVRGEVQRGRPLFKSKRVAEEVARMMNELWTYTPHWVEPVRETLKPEGTPGGGRHPRVMLEVH